MKTQIKATPIIASEGIEQSVMSMDNKGRDMATYFLRDKIYSNKIRAVVREYICNAVDEHKKFDVKKPVDVALTAQDNEIVFSVRDYAKGLSDDGVRKIFGMYFRSTKSDTNESIGGFGVGSKAGHAYTDTFNVISHYDGVKTSYSCMLGAGEHGVPVGHIYKLDECPTDETGIEVNLLVNTTDLDWQGRSVDLMEFKKEILVFIQFAKEQIVANINTKIKSDGLIFKTPKPIASETHESISLDVVPVLTDQKGNTHNHNMMPYRGECAVRMGDVIYDRITCRELGGKQKKDHCNILTVPIGYFDIPINRESLEDTDKNTRQLDRAKTKAKHLVDKDKEQFADLDLVELVHKHKKEGSENILNTDITEKGKLFDYGLDAIYGKVFRCARSMWNWTPNFDFTHKENELDPKTNKPILAVIPENRAKDKWKLKLKDYTTTLSKNIPAVSENYLCAELYDHYEVTPINKLKFPRNKVATNKATVWQDGDKDGLYGALELHNKMRRICDLKEAKTLAQAKKQNEKLFKESQKIKHVKTFMLCELKSGRTHYNGGAGNFYVGSAKLKKDLESIGIVSEDTPDNRKLARKLADKQDRELKTKRLVENMQELDYVPPRIKRIIKKHPSKAWIIQDVYERIIEENSLRGKILKQLHKVWSVWEHKELSREDIRKILNLK